MFGASIGVECLEHDMIFCQLHETCAADQQKVYARIMQCSFVSTLWDACEGTTADSCTMHESCGNHDHASSTLCNVECEFFVARNAHCSHYPHR